MAQKLRNIILGSPGFYGLNTELSPVELPPQYCTVTNNCILDAYGRLGARKGFNTQTDSITALGGEPIKRIFEWNSSGTSVLLAVGNSKIFRIDTTTTTNDTLTELTLPVAYSITADDWDFADFNGEGYFFQAGHEPLLINTTLNAADSVDTLDNQSTESVPAAPEGNIVMASIGRLWTSGVSGSPEIVYWSDTLIGDGWTEGASGSIDLASAWPGGYDEVQALGYQNGRLIIFGRNCILIYAGADDPATMQLEDTIEGTGCIARDSLQNTGDDLLFLSSTGVRSLGRTIQEVSIPMGSLTENVRTQLIDDVSGEGTGINSVYSPEEKFYLLIFEGRDIIYYLDFKGELEGGIRRICTWGSTLFNCMCRTDAGTLYVGGTPGIGTYSGYQDDGASYRYRYYSPALTFDTPANLKILKKIRPVFIGASGEAVTVLWGYGYTGVYTSYVITLSAAGATAEYGIAEYGEDEYSIPISVQDPAVNTTGSGEEVNFGIEVDINGNPFSLQQVGVYALIGRII